MAIDSALVPVDAQPVDAVHPDSGELVRTDSLATLPERVHGASAQPVSDEQATILQAPILATDIDILPTGEIYLSQVGYRRRLNAAFRPGGWAMVPLGKPAMVGKTLIQEWALFINGRFISSAWGEADYHESNDRQSYATAAESLKSNALMRCCKDLGIASECWDRRFGEAFKRDNCVRVYRPKVKVQKDSDRFQWRRKDAQPFWDEPGAAGEQPAQSAPQTPAAPRQATTSSPVVPLWDDAEPAPHETPFDGEPVPRQTPPERKAQASGNGAMLLISPKQDARLYAKAMQAGWNINHLNNWLKKHYGVQGTKNVARKHYDEICAAVDKGPGDDTE